MFWLLLCSWKQLRYWLSTTKRHENSKIAQPACNFIFIFTCSPFIARHFNPEQICVVTTELTKFSCFSCFKFNRVWSLNKWPTRFTCQARSMDTTLRFKAMEKESLTSKFLFNRYYIFFILVQYMLVSVQCMKGFRSLPLITFKIPWHFRGCFWEWMGNTRKSKWAAKCFPALSFMETGLNF